jgi:hypothetical protein
MSSLKMKRKADEQLEPDNAKRYKITTEGMPDDILRLIMKFTSIWDKIRHTSKVNKQWNTIIEFDEKYLTAWHRLSFMHFKEISLVSERDVLVEKVGNRIHIEMLDVFHMLNVVAISKIVSEKKEFQELFEELNRKCTKIKWSHNQNESRIVAPNLWEFMYNKRFVQLCKLHNIAKTIKKPLLDVIYATPIEMTNLGTIVQQTDPCQLGMYCIADVPRTINEKIIPLAMRLSNGKILEWEEILSIQLKIIQNLNIKYISKDCKMLMGGFPHIDI